MDNEMTMFEKAMAGMLTEQMLAKYLETAPIGEVLQIQAGAPPPGALDKQNAIYVNRAQGRKPLSPEEKAKRRKARKRRRRNW